MQVTVKTVDQRREFDSPKREVQFIGEDGKVLIEACHPPQKGESDVHVSRNGEDLCLPATFQGLWKRAQDILDKAKIANDRTYVKHGYDIVRVTVTELF